jgi:hypothetical protein
MSTEDQAEKPQGNAAKISSNALPEALFVASLTALSYWVGFLYQASYLYFFRLPPELAEVSLQSIMVGFLAVAILFVTFSAIDVVGIFSPDDPTRQQLVFPLIFLVWFTALAQYFEFKLIYLLLCIPLLYVILPIFGNEVISSMANSHGLGAS